MDGLLAWFDLNGSGAPIGPAATTEMPLLQQMLLYVVVVLGVLLSEAVAMARGGTDISIRLSRPWVLVACMVALVVFPAVWREVGTMQETSLLVQMGLAAQGGVFWGVIVAGAEKQVDHRAGAALGTAEEP
jgi:archaellum biogenesis protein FlaJ (TadC family)